MSKIIASHIDRWYGGEKQNVQLKNSKTCVEFQARYLNKKGNADINACTSNMEVSVSLSNYGNRRQIKRVLLLELFKKLD